MSWIRTHSLGISERLISTHSVNEISNRRNNIVAVKPQNDGPDEAITLWAGPIFKTPDDRIDPLTYLLCHSVFERLCSRIDREPVADMGLIAEEVIEEFAADHPVTVEKLIAAGWLRGDYDGTEGTEAGSSSSTGGSTAEKPAEKRN